MNIKDRVESLLESPNKFVGINHLTERYRSDPQFSAVVKQLYHFMIQQNIRPYEVRDAAFVAEMLYRETHIEPIAYHYKDREKL